MLAEEDELDRRLLWRLGSWAFAAVAAVIVGIMASQTQLGWRRDQSAAADLVQQANRLQNVARESHNEARRLASAVDTLNSDRDRLYSRVTVLEQGLDSVTGAIARQTATPAPPQDTPPASPPPAPAVAPVATTPPPPSDKAAVVAIDTATANVASTAKGHSAKDAAPKDAGAKDAGAKDSGVKDTGAKDTAIKDASVKGALPKDNVAKDNPAKDGVVKDSAAKDTPVKEAAKEPAPIKEASKDITPKAAATPAAPLMDSKLMMAPPDPAAGKLIEPPRPPAPIVAGPPLPIVAAAPPGESAEPEAADITLPKVQRTEFGVDLGGANSLSGLRTLWRGLLKSRANAPLTELQPIIVIRENNRGYGMQLRLVAGPLSDAAAAARLCAMMTGRDRHCETTVYDGQRLTLRADDAVPEAKPVAPARRKNTSKRASLEEPKQPERSSGWSSIFSKKLGQ